MSDDPERYGLYLKPGTPVRYDGLVDGGPEYGVVVHCWMSEDIKMYECYVAFFGNQIPSGELAEIPYILRYGSTSLVVLDAADFSESITSEF